MKMTWRWYGEGNDQIKLSDIKQIPGVEGIVWALHDKMPGEIWQAPAYSQYVSVASCMDIQSPRLPADGGGSRR